MYIDKIKTDRLIIRKHLEKDFEDFLSMNSDLEVMRFIGNENTSLNSNKNYYISWFKELLSNSKINETEILAVLEKETNHYIGFNGIFIPPDHNIYELAFRFQKENWSKGYATESSIAILKKWFNYKPNSKVLADYHPDNIGSEKILQNLGFIKVDNKYDEGTDEYLTVAELSNDRFVKQLTKRCS
ncbi:MAG TPA: GNAT family N-acetyltransferase [Victivallales bacterium]|nr:GNAT family N-acetyltransferase [Victivallales bacterium]